MKELEGSKLTGPLWPAPHPLAATYIPHLYLQQNCCRSGGIACNVGRRFKDDKKDDIVKSDSITEM